MKKIEKMIQNNQLDAFNRRLNNWQSIIGVPNWNFSSPTAEQYRTYENRGRQLQAEALRDTTSSVTKWLLIKITKTVSSTITAINKYLQHQQDIKELTKLNDRDLKDMGLTRADVYGFVHRKVTAKQLNAQRLGPAESRKLQDKQVDELTLAECSMTKISDFTVSKSANDVVTDKMAS